METLSEIRREEDARRTRAYEFESLQGRAISLRSNIARLEKEAESFDTSALREISELCAKIPTSIVTDGRSSLGLSVPSGIQARAAVMQVVDAGLRFGARREADSQEQLKAARAELKKVEKELQAFA